MLRTLTLQVAQAIILRVLFFLPFVNFLIFWRPDIVVFSVPPGESIICTYFAAKLLRRKTVLDVRDEWEDVLINASGGGLKVFYVLLKKLMSLLYMKADQVITVTHPLARKLVGRGVERIRVVPNGADTDMFRPYRKDKKSEIRASLGLRESDFVIVYSGSTGGYYRLDKVIVALTKMIDDGVRDVQFVIIGSGEMQRTLELASRLGVEDKVKYFGAKHDPEEVARIIAEADVGIIPFDDNPLWTSALPRKFFEFCSCGIPIIACAREDSSLARMIHLKKIGMTVPPMNPDKLANAFEQLYSNPRLREEAGRRARIIVEESFDRNKIAEEYLKLLEVIVNA